MYNDSNVVYPRSSSDPMDCASKNASSPHQVLSGEPDHRAIAPVHRNTGRSWQALIISKLGDVPKQHSDLYGSAVALQTSAAAGVLVFTGTRTEPIYIETVS